MQKQGMGRILVVDDEESIRRLLDRKLSAMGYSCALAADGVEAINRFGGDRFDLALTDIRMPNMDGLDLTKALRQRDEPLSVIILTAFGDMETAVEALRLGAFDFLLKPIEFDRLSVAVKNGIERTRLIRENKEYTTSLEIKVKERTAELVKKNDELRKNFFETVMALVAATEAKDKYTEGHSRRVAINARVLAERIGLSREESERIYAAGLLHDTGKIGIPDGILLKAGVFSPEERAIMQNHTTFSAEILSNVESFRDILHFVLYHHEQWDGTGYPAGLKGEEIPLGARILSMADLFDAMTSIRPHKFKMKRDDAMEEIKRVSGKQVDPNLTEPFIGLIRENLVITEE